MSDLNLTQHFFNGREIRTVLNDSGEVYFVAKDVAEALGYRWAGSATISHIPEEWRGVNSVLTPSGTQDMSVITEQGFYFFLGRSDKAGALPMQKWVAGEVLPSIRRNGGYIADQEQEANPAIIMARALRVAESVLKEHAAKLEQAHSVIDRQRPAVDFAIRIASADKGVKLGNFAKSSGLGPRKIFDILRSQKILMSGGDRHNLPYQEYIDRGYFTVRQSAYEANEEVRISHTPLITGKGEQWLTRRLLDKGVMRAVANN